MVRKQFLRWMACLAGGLALQGASLAQEAYPVKPVRVIVPFVAGGGGDILARLVMNRVATELGQPVVFENLPGAGGNVGSIAGARAANDGYTLLYGTNGTLAINQTLYRKPGFDPLVDFQPVSS
ncbi:MAG: tripartite tricarboxylate transporter substrate-binding protein [Rhodoferax sp.]